MTTKTMTMTEARYAAACIAAACIAVAGAAAADAKNATASSCQAMADKLNARFAVGSSRFDAGGSTGQEARDKLSKWMETNGLLISECVPQGFPADAVRGPCTDGYVMDHVAASWIGLTDRAKDLVEDGALAPFPAAAFGGIGLVFDTSNSKSELLCISPTDSASAARGPDAEGNPGCGPMKNDWNFGQDSKKPVYESYLKDKTNETALFEIGGFANSYVADVASWTTDKWWEAGKTWEDISCSELDPVGKTQQNTTAFTPIDTASMEACVAYTKDPTNFWNENATTIGEFSIINALGQWDPAAPPYQEVLGHPYCNNDDQNPCVDAVECAGETIEWAGACTWAPEDFMAAIDMQLEIASKAGPAVLQWNEASIPIEADTAQGVEAIFVVNSKGAFVGTDAQLRGAEEIEKANPEVPELPPSNITQYLNEAAKQLAGGYYGGVPVVYLTPTKEKALAGEVFGCEYDF